MWVAIKYVFGYKSNYGDWDTFLFKPLDEAKLLAYLNKTDLTFKQKFELDFIPAIERMIEKERIHLDFLIKNKAKQEFIDSSNSHLNHFKLRLSEYIEYAKTIE